MDRGSRVERRSSRGGSHPAAPHGSHAIGIQARRGPSTKPAGNPSGAASHETGNSWYIYAVGGSRRAAGIRKVVVMTLWFFRILAIIIGPVIGWFEISNDWKGILIGVGA